MKGKPKMKLKNVLLKFALCAVVALSSCAALADLAPLSWTRTSYSYHALSRSEWILEQKDESVKSFRDKLYEHPEEIIKRGFFSVGVALGILAFVYIFLRRHKRFLAAKKFLFFLPLTLPCLSFLFWYLCLLGSHHFTKGTLYVAEIAHAEIAHFDDGSGGYVDVTVKPKAGETYEEYLDRVRQLNRREEELERKKGVSPSPRPRPHDYEDIPHDYEDIK